MFKNRIRTAALAGAIAVATGVSGLAVPAYAQDANPTLNINNSFNTSDGSEAVVAQPLNGAANTEDGLRDATKAIDAFIAGLDQQPVVEVINDPAEEAYRDAFDAKRKAITTQLAAASQAVTDARNGVAYAKQADEAAEAAYKAWLAINPTYLSVKAVNDLIAKADEASKDQNGVMQQEALPRLTAGNAATLAPQVKALEDRLDAVLTPNSDKSNGDYVVRYYVPALQAAVKAAQDLLAAQKAADAKYEAEKAAAKEKMQAAYAEAQKSDAIVRQYFVAKATAQRNLLRVAEAQYSSAARFVDLYEANADENIVNQAGQYTTLRSEYKALAYSLGEDFDFNKANYETAVSDAANNFLVWASDLGDFEAEKAKLSENQKADAANNLNNLKINAGWQERVAYLQNIDAALTKEKLDAAAAAEAAKIAAEEAAKKAAADEAAQKAQAEKDAKAAEQAAATQKAIADALAKIAAGQNNTNETPDKGSSAGGATGILKVLGVLAAVGGVIAAICAAFPQIANHFGIRF